MADYPNIFTLAGLLKAADGTCQTALPGGRWVPARPLGFQSFRTRLRAAWLALTGKGDVVIWPASTPTKDAPQ